MYKSFFRPYLEAEGGAAGGGESSGSEPQGAGTNDSKDAAEKPKTFDEILKDNPSFQAELDRRLGKAAETAAGNERNRLQIIQDELQDEVLRVSKMTEAEKDAYFKKKADDEARKREIELTKRELTLDARTALKEKGLPDEFVDLLVYTDKKACDKSIETLEKVFTEAVQNAVNEKLKGTEPPKDAKTEGDPVPPSDFDKVKAEAMKIAGLKTK